MQYYKVWIWAPESQNWETVGLLARNRMYEPVNVLGRAIRAEFVPQCIMEACSAGHLNFSLSFLHIL